MSPSIDVSAYHNVLRSFLAEDLGAGDITTETVISSTQRARGEVIAKAPLVLAGIELFVEVFRILDSTTEAQICRHDGEELVPGQIPARVMASARALLTGERVALNLLQRLSGVATVTRQFVRAVAGTSAQIVDTRKTTPGLRALEKYAVRVGGGHNHRKDLGAGVLIKDNHVAACGGVRSAIERARAAAPHTARIECEVDSFEQLEEALTAGADIVLLDNVPTSMVEEAVRRTNGRALLEASGGVTLARVAELARAGVDAISVGALTHSVPAADVGLDFDS